MAFAARTIQVTKTASSLADDVDDSHLLPEAVAVAGGLARARANPAQVLVVAHARTVGHGLVHVAVVGGIVGVVLDVAAVAHHVLEVLVLEVLLLLVRVLVVLEVIVGVGWGKRRGSAGRVVHVLLPVSAGDVPFGLLLIVLVLSVE